MKRNEKVMSLPETYEDIVWDSKDEEDLVKLYFGDSFIKVYGFDEDEFFRYERMLSPEKLIDMENGFACTLMVYTMWPDEPIIYCDCPYPYIVVKDKTERRRR